jgi:hypothetical protein
MRALPHEPPGPMTVMYSGPSANAVREDHQDMVKTVRLVRSAR